MADTVRTIQDLLTILFVRGQPDRSINEQDVRDAIVSISLETTDLSVLPRSTNGLNIGRLWIDGAKALRILSTWQPNVINIVDAGKISGVGSLTANAVVPGRANVYPASATLAGAGGTTLTPARPIVGAGTTAAATSTLSATATMLRRNNATILGAGGLTAIAISGGGSGAFSTAFSSAFNRVTSGTNVVRTGTTQINALGGISAIGTPVSGQRWGTVAPSMTLSNGNLMITRTGGLDGQGSTARASQFRTSGKFYWEVVLAGSASTSEVGFGNPSQAVGDNTRFNGGNNSIEYYTFAGVGGLAINAAYVQDMPAFTTASNVSFALDVTNGRWWVRVNGGTWIGAGNAAGDPVAGTNPITALCSTTGGLGPTAELNTVNQSQTLKIAQSSWTYTAPSGFVAM